MVALMDKIDGENDWIDSGLRSAVLIQACLIRSSNLYPDCLHQTKFDVWQCRILPGAVLLLGAGLVRLTAYARRRENKLT